MYEKARKWENAKNMAKVILLSQSVEQDSDENGELRQVFRIKVEGGRWIGLFRSETHWESFKAVFPTLIIVSF